MKNMYKSFIAGTIVMIFLLSIPQKTCAEKIYMKDGRVLKEDINYRNRGVVWIRKSIGSIGINVKDIDRIENNDGSVSKYDYRALGSLVQKSIRDSRYGDAVFVCDMCIIQIIGSLPR